MCRKQGSVHFPVYSRRSVTRATGNCSGAISSTLAIRPPGTAHRVRTRVELGEVFQPALCDGTGENPDAPSSADVLLRAHRRTWAPAWCTKPLGEAAACLGGRADRPA